MSPSYSDRALRQVRRLGFAIFYRLPGPLRRRLVRLTVATYTVGAVAIVHDSDSSPPGRMLLLRQPPGLGWSLPAGLLARGERPVDGCVRELREESGITLAAHELVAATPNAVVHTRGLWVDLVFEASIPSSSMTLQVDGAEVLEAGWHRLDGLPPLTPPTARLLSIYGIGPYADCSEAIR